LIERQAGSQSPLKQPGTAGYSTETTTINAPSHACHISLPSACHISPHQLDQRTLETSAACVHQAQPWVWLCKPLSADSGGVCNGRLLHCVCDDATQVDGMQCAGGYRTTDITPNHTVLNLPCLALSSRLAQWPHSCCNNHQHQPENQLLCMACIQQRACTVCCHTVQPRLLDSRGPAPLGC
jgi:hypothetical protein